MKFPSSGSPFSTGLIPGSAVFSPTGGLLALANQANDNVSIASWAAAIWGSGEEWVYVSPGQIHLTGDVTYAPGWAHPVAYYFAFSLLVSGFTGLAGAYLRRGAPEF